MKRKLIFEPVPEPLWFKSVYRMISRADWNKIRAEVVEANNGFCEICERPYGNNCHEVWIYDDVKHIQKLDRFQLLCQACHNIKHLGRSEIGARNGEIDMDYLIFHYCKVNQCSKDDFEKDKEQAFIVYRKRSQFKWKQDFSFLKELKIKVVMKHD